MALSTSNELFSIGEEIFYQGALLRIIDRVGEGFTAVVYEATWQHEGKPLTVAVKALKPLDIPEARKKFLEEAQALSLLMGEEEAANQKQRTDFKIAPRYFGYDIHNNVDYIVMEFIHGIELPDLLMQRSNGRMAEKDALLAGWQFFRTLDIVHNRLKKNFIDLKFENLWWVKQPDGEGQLKMTDFGTLADIEGGLGSVSRDLLLGSIILFRLLTGYALDYNIHGLKERAEPILEQHDYLSWGTKRILRRALHRVPERRYATARDIALALRQLVDFWRADNDALYEKVTSNLDEAYKIPDQGSAKARRYAQNAMAALSIIEKRAPEYKPTDIQNAKKNARDLLEKGGFLQTGCALFMGGSYTEAYKKFLEGRDEGDNPGRYRRWAYLAQAMINHTIPDDKFERARQEAIRAIDEWSEKGHWSAALETWEEWQSNLNPKGVEALIHGCELFQALEEGEKSQAEDKYEEAADAFQRASKALEALPDADFVRENETGDLRARAQKVEYAAKTYGRAKKLLDEIRAMLPAEQALPQGQVEQVVPEEQAKQTLSERQTAQAVSQGQVEQAVPGGQAGQAVPEEQAKQAPSERQTEQALPQGQVEQAVPEEQAEQALSEGQTAQAIPEGQAEKPLSKFQEAIKICLESPSLHDDLRKVLRQAIRANLKAGDFRTALSFFYAARQMPDLTDGLQEEYDILLALWKVYRAIQAGRRAEALDECKDIISSSNEALVMPSLRNFLARIEQESFLAEDIKNLRTLEKIFADFPKSSTPETRDKVSEDIRSLEEKIIQHILKPLEEIKAWLLKGNREIARRIIETFDTRAPDFQELRQVKAFLDWETQNQEALQSTNRDENILKDIRRFSEQRILRNYWQDSSSLQYLKALRDSSKKAAEQNLGEMSSRKTTGDPGMSQKSHYEYTEARRNEVKDDSRGKNKTPQVIERIPPDLLKHLLSWIESDQMIKRIEGANTPSADDWGDTKDLLARMAQAVREKNVKKLEEIVQGLPLVNNLEAALAAINQENRGTITGTHPPEPFVLRKWQMFLTVGVVGLISLLVGIMVGSFITNPKSPAFVLGWLSPTPTWTATLAPSATPTSTATPTPTATITPSVTPTSTSTPTPVPTSTYQVPTDAADIYPPIPAYAKGAWLLGNNAVTATPPLSENPWQRATSADRRAKAEPYFYTTQGNVSITWPFDQPFPESGVYQVFVLDTLQHSNTPVTYTVFLNDQPVSPDRGINTVIYSDAQRTYQYEKIKGRQIDHDAWLSLGFYRIQAGQTLKVQTNVPALDSQTQAFALDRLLVVKLDEPSTALYESLPTLPLYGLVDDSAATWGTLSGSECIPDQNIQNAWQASSDVPAWGGGFRFYAQSKSSTTCATLPLAGKVPPGTYRLWAWIPAAHASAQVAYALLEERGVTKTNDVKDAYLIPQTNQGAWVEIGEWAITEEQTLIIRIDIPPNTPGETAIDAFALVKID